MKNTFLILLMLTSVLLCAGIVSATVDPVENFTVTQDSSAGSISEGGYCWNFAIYAFNLTDNSTGYCIDNQIGYMVNDSVTLCQNISDETTCHNDPHCWEYWSYDPSCYPKKYCDTIHSTKDQCQSDPQCMWVEFSDYTNTSMCDDTVSLPYEIKLAWNLTSTPTGLRIVPIRENLSNMSGNIILDSMSSILGEYGIYYGYDPTFYPPFAYLSSSYYTAAINGTVVPSGLFPTVTPTVVETPAATTSGGTVQLTAEQAYALAGVSSPGSKKTGKPDNNSIIGIILILGALYLFKGKGRK